MGALKKSRSWNYDSRDTVTGIFLALSFFREHKATAKLLSATQCNRLEEQGSARFVITNTVIVMLTVKELCS